VDFVVLVVIAGTEDDLAAGAGDALEFGDFGLGLIAEDVPTNEMFAWRVDDHGYAGATRNRFRIRIVDMADPYCTNVSDVFTIR